jgi:secretion/DNA translocation related CpaE-like protein
VVLLSTDPAIVAAVGDAAAAAGVALEDHDAWPGARSGPRPVAVLVGWDAAPDLMERGVPTAAPVLLVGPDEAAAQLWRSAGGVGAVGAVPLPSASAWLVQWLLEQVGPQGDAGAGVVAAVFGACGGAGASTLAAAVAVHACRAGAKTLLVDADPGPAGVELLLADTGPHWPDAALATWRRFAGSRGSLSPDLLAALPSLDGVACLGWGGLAPPEDPQGPLWRGALASVCAAASAVHRLVLLDCGADRSVAAALPAAVVPVLVVPGSVRGLVHGRVAVAELREAFPAEPVVVLRDAGGSRTPRGCEEELGRSGLWWDLDPHLAHDEEVGRPPGTRRRSPTARVSRAVLARLASSRQP